MADFRLVLTGEELGDRPGQHPDEADPQQHQDDDGAPPDAGLGDDVPVANGRGGGDGPPVGGVVGDPLGDTEHGGRHHDHGHADIEVVDQFIALEETGQSPGETDQAEEPEELQQAEGPAHLGDPEEEEQRTGWDDREQVKKVVPKEGLLVLGPHQPGEVVDGKDQPNPVVDQVVGINIDVDLLGIVGQQHDD